MNLEPTTEHENIFCELGFNRREIIDLYQALKHEADQPPSNDPVDDILFALMPQLADSIERNRTETWRLSVFWEHRIPFLQRLAQITSGFALALEDDIDREELLPHDESAAALAMYQHVYHGLDLPGEHSGDPVIDQQARLDIMATKFARATLPGSITLDTI